MRRLLVWGPPGQGDRIATLAREHGAAHIISLEGRHDADGPVDLRLITAPNQRVEDLLEALGEVERLHASFFPQGVLALDPPPDAPPDRVQDVTLRSPIEIFLSGLQSIGSWPGFLAYAAVGGLVAWIGLLTNTAYLLVGAMLIAPFAGPAMNAAIATARGDLHLFGRGVARYLAGIAVTVVVAAVATLLYRLNTPTQLMGDVTSLAVTTVLLPLAAGAAGAINLAQSERSSLVSGAATGMLVAAALAPPAGVLGMAAAIGEWGMAGRAAFVVALQLAGINTVGAAVFYVVGIRPEGARFPNGSRITQRITAVGSALALVALLAGQLTGAPALTRSSVAQRAESLVAREMEQRDGLLLDVDATFPSTGGTAETTMFVRAYVQTTAEGAVVADELRSALRRRFGDITPIVSVTTVEP